MPCLGVEGKRKKFSLSRKPVFLCMFLPILTMSLLRLALSMLFLAFASQGFTQVKNRDFTKRLGSQLKRYEGGTRVFGGNLNARISGKRLHVSEIPFHYSPFGGKRFPTNKVTILQKKELPTNTLNFPLAYGSARAGANDKRAIDDPAQLSSTTSVAKEFRDQFHDSLDKRIDDWMNKVNNLSMADVNRYQFRRGRSTKPGFPIQRAGSQTPSAPQPKPIVPANLQGKRSPLPKSNSQAPSRFWFGPRKVTTGVSRGSSDARSTGKIQSSTKKASPAPSSTFNSAPDPRKVDKSRYPTIRLGPRKITVETK